MARAYGDDLRRKFLSSYDEGEETLEELADRFSGEPGMGVRSQSRLVATGCRLAIYVILVAASAPLSHIGKGFIIRRPAVKIAGRYVRYLPDIAAVGIGEKHFGPIVSARR
jgi:hypothetical protein